MQENRIFSIEGKKALVTGGSMGIGMGIVKRFIESGAKVMIADMAEEPAMKYINSLSEEKKKNIAFVHVDLLDDTSPEKMVSEMVKQFGGIDILVNNAGIYPNAQMLEIKRELFDKVHNINLRALAFTAREAAKEMVKQKVKGRIINIASIDAFHPSQEGLAAYDSSKAGVVMFTKSFALELAKYGITVNAIAPGGILTEGTSMDTSQMDPEYLKKLMDEFLKLIPMGRYGEPDEIAKVAVFIASPASGYMTGETIIVDGGRLLM